jgi:hypothetical protein
LILRNSLTSYAHFLHNFKAVSTASAPVFIGKTYQTQNTLLYILQKVLTDRCNDVVCLCLFDHGTYNLVAMPLIDSRISRKEIIIFFPSTSQTWTPSPLSKRLVKDDNYVSMLTLFSDQRLILMKGFVLYVSWFYI